MFFKYQVTVSFYWRKDHLLAYRYRWEGAACSQSAAERRAIEAATRNKHTLDRFTYCVNPGHVQRRLTGFSKVLIGLTFAAAALLAAPAANAQNSNDFAALRTQNGTLTLEFSKCIDNGKVRDKLFSARFVFDGGRTLFGCYFIDPQLHEAVGTFGEQHGYFTYPLAAFHIYR